MARTCVTRGQVFEAADALVREGRNPTVVAVRNRLGGGSPNTITPLLSEWKALNETKQAAVMPAVPEPVEAVMRQVWGAAWQQAQSRLEAATLAERAAHVEDLRGLVKSLQGLQGGAEQARRVGGCCVRISIASLAWSAFPVGPRVSPSANRNGGFCHASRPIWWSACARALIAAVVFFGQVIVLKQMFPACAFERLALSVRYPTEVSLLFCQNNEN